MHINVHSLAGAGDPQTLVSDNGCNHLPSRWGLASAKIILNIERLDGERLLAGTSLQARVADELTRHYTRILKRERDHLNTFTDHCDSEYDITPFVAAALQDIQALAMGTPWQDLILGDDWAESAYLTIADHLATAVHVERLLFGDKHPDNAAARAYRRRFFQED